MNNEQVLDPLSDGISRIALIDRMGSDLSVVNAAKVSYQNYSETVGEKEAKLIKYLLKHKHVSPFYHPQASFLVKLPIFVARQWVKHRVGVAINEVSLRYVQKGQENPLEFYLPDTLRKQSKSNKQASEGQLGDADTLMATAALVSSYEEAEQAYHRLIELGVAREQARMTLPVATYTEFVCTMSLYAALHFINLRDHDGAQWEIQQYAKAMKHLLLPYFPVTMTTFEELNNG